MNKLHKVRFKVVKVFQVKVRESEWEIPERSHELRVESHLTFTEVIKLIKKFGQVDQYNFKESTPWRSIETPYIYFDNYRNRDFKTLMIYSKLKKVNQQTHQLKRIQRYYERINV